MAMLHPMNYMFRFNQRSKKKHNYKGKTLICYHCKKQVKRGICDGAFGAYGIPYNFFHEECFIKSWNGEKPVTENK